MIVNLNKLLFATIIFIIAISAYSGAGTEESSLRQPTDMGNVSNDLTGFGELPAF
jgi:hypothetical protein